MSVGDRLVDVERGREMPTEPWRCVGTTTMDARNCHRDAQEYTLTCRADDEWPRSVHVTACPTHLTDLVDFIEGSLRDLERARRRQSIAIAEDHERARVVYYLRRTDGAIKIGVSGRVATRKRTLEKEHGPLELLATHGGGRRAEAAQHVRFADSRIEGEWFEPSQDLVAHIARLTEVAA